MAPAPKSRSRPGVRRTVPPTRSRTRGPRSVGSQGAGGLEAAPFPGGAAPGGAAPAGAVDGVVVGAVTTVTSSRRRVSG